MPNHLMMKFKSYLLTTLLLCIFTILHSQNKTADSLLSIVDSVPDHEKISIYNELALMQRGVSIPRLIEYSSKSYEIAEKIEDAEKMVVALSHLGNATLMIGKEDTALLLYQKGYHIADSIDDKELKNDLANGLGQYYLSTDKYHLALSYYLEAYNYYKDSKMSANMARQLINISAVYWQMEKLQESLRTLIKAKELYISIGDSILYNDMDARIGLCYSDMHKYDSAFTFLNNSIDYCIKNDNVWLLMFNYQNIGLNYLYVDNEAQAIANLRKSYKLSQELTYPYMSGLSLLNIAQVYLKYENYDSALYYINEAKPYIEMTDNKENKGYMYEYYYKVYKAIDKPYLALENYITYKSITDSLFSQKRTARVDELQIQYETANKEAEIVKLANEIQISKLYQLIIGITSVILSILVIILIFYFRLKRKALLQQKQIAVRDAKHLQEKLDLQNKELACNAMSLAQISEMKLSIIEGIKGLNEHTNSEGKKQIYSLIGTIGNGIDKKAWKEFEMRFENVHVSFYENLNMQHPGLSPSERRVCAFLKLNLSTKDIAALLNISPRSVESTRYSIRKKINLPTSENLVVHLQTL
jgi:DNA-binding CsgD family transcriptional regulator